MEHTVYCNLLEYYCLNKLDEGVLAGLSDTVLGVFKNIAQYVKKMSSKLGVSIIDLINALKQKDVFNFLKTLGFNFAKMLDYIKQAYTALKGGINQIFITLSSSGVIQQLRSGAMKVDDLLIKYPLLKKLTGPVLAGLLLYMWINSSFTGDVGDDFDLSTILAALSGNFTINDLFLSPAGLKFLTLYSTSSLASFPYMVASFPMGLIVALVLTGYKKLKNNPEIVKKIQGNIKSLISEIQLRMEIRKILNEIYK